MSFIPRAASDAAVLPENSNTHTQTHTHSLDPNLSFLAIAAATPIYCTREAEVARKWENFLLRHSLPFLFSG